MATKLSLATANGRTRFVEIMEKALGIVTTACKNFGISRQTYYNARKQYPDFAEACDLIDDVALDFVETQLFELVQRGDAAAIMFYLRTKGRRRGYGDRAEVAVSGAGNMALSIEVIDSRQQVTNEDTNNEGI